MEESGNGRIQVQPGLGRDGDRESEREEWYGLTGVAMGTQLLKAGRVILEERLCAAGAKGCHPEASLGTKQTAHTGLYSLVSDKISSRESTCLKL